MSGHCPKAYILLRSYGIQVVWCRYYAYAHTQGRSTHVDLRLFILIGVLGSQPPESKSAAIYARMPSLDKNPDLDRQVDRGLNWATGQGY